MSFRAFVESDEALNWDAYWPKWRPHQIGDRGMINVYVTSRHISVDESPYHPMMKKALRILIRQKPYLAAKPLDFDGWSPGTLEEFIRSPEPIRPRDKLPKVMYHGTSYFRWERIREDGLKPQSESGAEYGAEPMSAPEANPDLIYLCGTVGAATRQYSRDVSRKEGSGSFPVILKIDTSGMDYTKLRPDEESRARTWQDSLAHLNTVAYEGSISPDKISIEVAYNPKTDRWEKPGPWLEPQDALAQAMLHRTGYKEIPGVGRYKWTKL